MIVYFATILRARSKNPQAGEDGSRILYGLAQPLQRGDVPDLDIHHGGERDTFVVEKWK
jgi:hypothetical protein